MWNLVPDFPPVMRKRTEVKGSAVVPSTGPKISAKKQKLEPNEVQLSTKGLSATYCSSTSEVAATETLTEGTTKRTRDPNFRNNTNFG
jgi:hypothetical protein